MKQRIWKKRKRSSSCRQRSRGGMKAQPGCLMSVWATTSKIFILPGFSVPQHLADEVSVPNAGCKREAQMCASVGSEKLRGAGPFPSAGDSHPTTLSWDALGVGSPSGTAQQRQEQD